MKNILCKCVILAAIFMMVAGCNSGTTSENGNAKSKTTSTSKKNGNDLTTEKKNEKTIQNFLKVEITGPNDEFKKAFGLKPNQGPNFALMNAYNKKYFEPLLSKDYYKEFINERYEVFWLNPAYNEGYQFKVKSIKIKKQKDDYSWTADLDYTKDGKTTTSSINGLIDLNENGKITYVRFIDGDDGLLKILILANPRKKRVKPVYLIKLGCQFLCKLASLFVYFLMSKPNTLMLLRTFFKPIQQKQAKLRRQLK